MTTTNEKGSVLGGALMVAGCCIGAAMLGLPVLSLSTGFVPTIVFFFLVWLYMATTGLLLLEVNLWFKEDTNIPTMAKRTLGRWGQAASWFLFLYLFYSIMVAYVQGAGDLFADFFEEWTGVLLPSWVGSLGISVLFGIFIYIGTHTVDLFNRFLMAGLIAFYILLLILGAPHVEAKNLAYQNWAVAPLLIPAMVISFGYHNLVASLSAYQKHDVAALRKTILIGSAIPLILYLFWEWVILGMVPAHTSFREALDSGAMASQILKKEVGSSWALTFVQAFSYFAIITSFLTVALSFVDFLSDGLKIPEKGWRKGILCLLTLGPPFLFGLWYPKFFLLALQYAGGFGAVALFGILPALMVWNGRYYQDRQGIRIVPGGKPMLAAVFAFSLATMIIQFFN